MASALYEKHVGDCAVPVAMPNSVNVNAAIHPDVSNISPRVVQSHFSKCKPSKL